MKTRGVLTGLRTLVLAGCLAGSAPTAVLAQQETQALQKSVEPGENERADVLPQNFLSAKAGIFRGAEALPDDVFYSELVLGRYLIGRFFAIEGNVGYLTREDNWGIPFFLNARGGFPIRFLEPYGGLGLGGLYVKGSTQNLSVDEVVFAADFFLGLNWNLGKRFYLGAEGKYILTQKTDLGLNLGGLAVTGAWASGFEASPTKSDGRSAQQSGWSSVLIVLCYRAVTAK